VTLVQPVARLAILVSVLCACGTGADPAAAPARGTSTALSGGVQPATLEAVEQPSQPSAPANAGVAPSAAPTPRQATPIGSSLPMATSDDSGSGSDFPPDDQATPAPEQGIPLHPTRSPGSRTPPTSARETPTTRTGRARLLVSERSGIPLDELRVVSERRVLWPDTSLGCRQRGVEAQPQLIPGYQILIEGQGQQFWVHGDEGRKLFVCDVPIMPGPERSRGSH
jgi:hypothetical protein